MEAKDYSPEEWAEVEAEIAKEEAWLHRFDDIKWTEEDEIRYAKILPNVQSQPTWVLEMAIETCDSDYVLFKAINTAMNSFRRKI